MPERPPRTLPSGWLMAVALGGILQATPAAAHKLNVFAFAEGKTIRGEVYFRGRVPARNAKLTAFGPAGEKLAETTSDERGEFSFEARFHCDHRLVADSGDGHGTEFTVSAGELPDSLPLCQGHSGTAGGQSPQAAPPPDAAHTPLAIPKDEELKELIEVAVGKQVVALRRQLDRYEQRTRLRDILGGIGYILGLVGLAYYFLGLRKRG